MANIGPMPALGDVQDCPCCGEQRPFKGMHTITDRYGWTWPLYHCRRCGVSYQATPMTDEARRDFYGSGRYRQVCEQVTGQPWTKPAYLRQAQKMYASLWTNLLRVNMRKGVWLDYGGSTGVVSREWALNRYPTPDVTVADYGDGATTTPEQALAVPDATYDAILCCQTLDHLRAPLATLEQFRRVAKPGARLFVDVVKFGSTHYKIDHDTYYFTAHSFLSLIERSGWVPLWLDAETNPTHYTVLAVKP